MPSRSLEVSMEPRLGALDHLEDGFAPLGTAGRGANPPRGQRPRPRTGDTVSFRFGTVDAVGRVTEERAPLGLGAGCCSAADSSLGWGSRCTS